MEWDSEAVHLTLGGKERRLRLTIGDLSLIYRTYHDDPLKMLQDVLIVEGEGDARTYRVGSIWALHCLLWASLRHDDADITMDQAADLAEAYRRGGGSVGDLAVAVWAAWHVGGMGGAKIEHAGDNEKNAGAEARRIQ